MKKGETTMLQQVMINQENYFQRVPVPEVKENQV